MPKFVKITGDRLNVEVCDDFLPKILADKLYSDCHTLVPFSDRNGRNSVIYGDPGAKYSVEYQGKAMVREATDWSELPVLNDIRDIVEAYTGIRFNFCSVMRYPSGKVGIGRHRDKEMIEGTVIIGISVGAERNINFHPPYDLSKSENMIPIKLPHGSLYSMLPPTNQHWSHEIPVQPDIEGIRYSLTFRNVNIEKMKLPEIKTYGICMAIMKSGLRQGQICGNNITLIGRDKCGIHSRKKDE